MRKRVAGGSKSRPGGVQRATDTNPFPRTRYQGSKRKIAGDIVERLRDLTFTTVLDAFGGTGSVSYALKREGRHVTFNDVLAFNHQIGLALIENDGVTLDEVDVKALTIHCPNVHYEGFIARTFGGIYFTDEENAELDVIVGNVRRLECPYKRALAWNALFQSCMAKRPYNLFHRRNLYMRMADVERSFGNKASWDRSFADHLRDFATGANRAVIDGGGTCRAVSMDALKLEPAFDLVYIDTPYINDRGVGVDYRDFYHFLEGMVHYDAWPTMIDRTSKHLRLQRSRDPWSCAATIPDRFARLFSHFRESILVVSYRSDGTPPIEQIAEMLGAVKSNVRVITMDRNQYALSTRRNSREILLIGSD